MFDKTVAAFCGRDPRRDDVAPAPQPYGVHGADLAVCRSVRAARPLPRVAASQPAALRARGRGRRARRLHLQLRTCSSSRCRSSASSGHSPRDWRDSNRLGYGIIALALFLAASLVAAASMIQYAHEHTFEWRYHQKVVGVTYQDEWDDASVAGKDRHLARQSVGVAEGTRLGRPHGPWRRPRHRRTSSGRARRVRARCSSASRWRSGAGSARSTLCLSPPLLLLPWGALLTVGDGLFRRTLGLAPFIAVLAALPLAWAWGRDPGSAAALVARLSRARCCSSRRMPQCPRRTSTLVRCRTRSR